MYYGNIKKLDIADGPGVRVTLFVSGCTHHCPECFNPETWDFKYGQPFTADTEEELIKALSLPHVAGLTLLGGEPMEPVNQAALTPFLRRVRDAYPQKTVWCYSGYTFEELTGIEEGCRARCATTDEMLSMIDVLVDGEFKREKKNLMLRFRGSTNQRILDLKASLKEGKAVIADPSIGGDPKIR